MLLFALVFSHAVPALAKDYVSDNAHIFGTDAVKRIALIDAELEQKTGVFVGVMTVKKAGEPLDMAAPRAALAHHVNGAMIYVERDSRRFAIAYGTKAQSLFTPAQQTSIEQSLSAAFRAGEYDAGIVAAVASIAQVLAGGRSGGHGPVLAAAATPQPQRDSGFGWVFWVGVLIIGTLLMLVVLRRR